MDVMNYTTPGLEKIDFEDNFFVTTELNKDENLEVKGYIESRGGVIKNSVTRTTDYLIYKDGEEETTKYKKALELIRDKGLEIKVLSLKTFSDLLTMKDTPDVSEISIKDHRFVVSGLGEKNLSTVKKHVEEHGGIVQKSVTGKTDYLIYPTPSRWNNNWETEEYAEAMSMRQNDDADIIVLSFDRFSELVTMKRETPNVPEIFIKGRRFAVSGLGKEDLSTVKNHVKKHGGILEDSVTADTDYLIFNNSAWETKEYAEAMSMEREDGSGITVLSFETFVRLDWNALEMEAMEFGTCLPKKGGERRPIRWIVVKKEQNRALLLSSDGICRRPYNEERVDVTWETCTLREWLNGDFYDDAFTEEEKKRILLTEVRNEDNPKWNTPGGNDTQDRVFLLSIREAEEWLTGIERRNGHWWWLRSPGYYPNSAAYVYVGGFFSGVYGASVGYSDGTVCPALWIDLGSEIE